MDQTTRLSLVPNAQTHDRLLTAQEIADRLRISRARAYELLRLNVFPVVRIRRQVRVCATSVEAFISRGGAPLPE
jgi:excisionase family DNA binding protein